MLAKQEKMDSTALVFPAPLFCLGWRLMSPDDYRSGSGWETSGQLSCCTWLKLLHMTLSFFFGQYYPRPDLSPEVSVLWAGMILPLPGGNRTSPGRKMGLDHKL